MQIDFPPHAPRDPSSKSAKKPCAVDLPTAAAATVAQVEVLLWVPLGFPLLLFSSSSWLQQWKKKKLKKQMDGVAEVDGEEEFGNVRTQAYRSAA